MLSGISPVKVKQFQNKGIFTVEDLLGYFPRKYMDFRFAGELNASNIGKEIAVLGYIRSCQIIGKGKNILKVCIETKSGLNLDVFWFHQDYLYDKYSMWINLEVAVCGKLCRDKIKFRNYSMVNPMFFSRSPNEVMKLFPVYKKVTGMADEYLKKSIEKAIKICHPQEYLSDEARDKFRLCSYDNLFQKIHFPKDSDDINASKRRIIFDDLYYFSSKLVEESVETKTSKFIA